MASLAAFKNPAGYHLLSYGTLLGSTLFQSFIGGIIAFRVLPRPQFSSLQKNIFPVYFTLQTVTPLLMVLTYPSRSGYSALYPSATQLRADKLAFYLLSSILATGIVNWTYVGPQTTEVMKLRKHQETRDGKKSYDSGPHSKEMEELNRRFGILHGISSLVNLGGFIAMLWYGVLLGEKVAL